MKLVKVPSRAPVLHVSTTNDIEIVPASWSTEQLENNNHRYEINSFSNRNQRGGTNNNNINININTNRWLEHLAQYRKIYNTKGMKATEIVKAARASYVPQNSTGGGCGTINCGSLYWQDDVQDDDMPNNRNQQRAENTHMISNIKKDIPVNQRGGLLGWY